MDPLAFLRVLLLLAAFVMLCVGASQWQFGNGKMRYYFTGHQKGGEGMRVGYTCDPFRDRMRVGLSFTIMGLIAAFCGLLVSVVIAGSELPESVDPGAPALRKRGLAMRKVSMIPVGIAFALLTIAWPATESARSGTHCGVNYADHGFGISRGLALLIAAWVLLFVDLVCAALSTVLFRASVLKTLSRATF